MTVAAGGSPRGQARRPSQGAQEAEERPVDLGCVRPDDGVRVQVGLDGRRAVGGELGEEVLKGGPVPWSS